MVTDEELKRVYDIFTVSWRFYKKFADVQQCDSYWEMVVNEAVALNQEYQYELCKDLILAVLDELERKGKAQGKV